MREMSFVLRGNQHQGRRGTADLDMCAPDPRPRPLSVKVAEWQSGKVAKWKSGSGPQTAHVLAGGSAEATQIGLGSVHCRYAPEGTPLSTGR